jgi:comEA protein
MTAPALEFFVFPDRGGFLWIFSLYCVEIILMDSLPEEENQSNLEVFWIAYKVPLILGAVSISFIILSLVLLVKSTQTTTPIQFSSSDDVAGTASASLRVSIVDVEGAVANPGTYSLASDARVEDAIEAAGGLTSGADEKYIAKNINRAMKVSDGMKVYIPETGDGASQDATSHNLGTVVATPGTSSQNSAFVSVNMASKDELDSLPGVGPVTAQKIIDNRPYATLEDLVTKKAIGSSLYEKLKNQLSL